MSFTSLHFLIFFPVILILYNLIPNNLKVIFLLVASYLFYINLQPIYAVLLLGVTVCTYLFAKGIAQVKSEKNKKLLLSLGIIVVIFPLFFYKYFGFINESINSLLGYWGIGFSLPTVKYLLPIGISFYTFMAIGYLVDVYNETIEFQKNFFSTGLFLSFFPIILSGPIERSDHFFPQLERLTNSKSEDLVAGARMMLWGYFMKLCVADRLGLYVDAVYNNVLNHSGTTLAFASILYPFQVYADLGGYSLLAIGVARCMGINIIENFKRPFFATSMSEFWRRWHISLIKWLTDYIYTPLSFCFRRWKIWGIFAALLLTFLISGIWHGAALTFIFWGLIQGVYLCIDAATHNRRSIFEEKHHLTKKWWWIGLTSLIVFLLFAFSQIFGISDSIGQAYQVITKIFSDKGDLFIDLNTLLNGLICLFILFIKDFLDEFSSKKYFTESKNSAVRYFAFSAMIILIIIFGVFDGNQFIYFQF